MVECLFGLPECPDRSGLPGWRPPHFPWRDGFHNKEVATTDKNDENGDDHSKRDKKTLAHAGRVS
jgi:hypothetical protein